MSYYYNITIDAIKEDNTLDDDMKWLDEYYTARAEGRCQAEIENGNEEIAAMDAEIARLEAAIAAAEQQPPRCESEASHGDEDEK